MYIADMHCDSLLAVNSERGLVNGYNTSKRYPWLQFFAAFVPFEGRSAEERRHKLMQYLNVYLYETDRLGIRRIYDVRDLTSAQDEDIPSAIFSIEGGGGLFADADELFTLHKAGLRVMGLAWDSNELACSAWDDEDTGLSSEGVRMINRLSELGITPDVSHLSDKSFYDVCNTTPMPIIATHSNFREICNSPRNLTLGMAKEIVARGGVIGLNLYPSFLKEGAEATADDILRHVDFALEHLGERALGFGCDIDGTDGKYPKGFGEGSSIHDRLTELLLSHYSEATVRRITGENVLDFLKGTL